MRNAERFLSQGKIRAAINEYQRVVENDPKDFSTLNILGDLHAKNFNKQEAVGCFTQVAEHYHNQGFSHKAIAIYNKIFRIEPHSMEISAKLAQLYHMKGSVAEARKHYTTLAEQYQNRGQKIEALTIWRQIAELDPHNTEIYLKIADAYCQEKQLDDAAWAFTEAGWRLNQQEKYESSLTAFSRALEIKNDDLRALKGLVKAQIGLGDPEEAAQTLEKVFAEQPYNRDVLYLLVDCYLEAENLSEAEKVIFKLVEQEPANYPKFLELVKLHLKGGNLDAAVRILTHSAEHLLVGGQAENFLEWTNEILAKNPERTDAVRLLVQYCSWQRDPHTLKESLERLVETARANGDVENERYALSQLVLTAPKTEITQRLQEINTAQGFETDTATDAENYFEVSQFENFALVEDFEESDDFEGKVAEFSFAEIKSTCDFESNGTTQNGQNGHHGASNGSSNGTKEAAFYDATSYAEIVEDFPATEIVNSESAAKTGGTLKISDELKLQKELESIEFYIEQGYQDLAAKSLDELEAQFGTQPQISDFRARLYGFAPTPEIKVVSEKETSVATKSNNSRKVENLDDLSGELDAEETDNAADRDDRYETHFHLATAYQEMGLLEDAIREFQDAVNLIEMNDGTRRFFHCANLLGHCFLEKQMPHLAVIWYRRSLEVADLQDEEKQALYYELGNAFEAGGEIKSSVQYFEKLYAEDINYRDVSRRLENLRAKNS
ncbi:MAG: tetratricopeptide repeat protein [Pyrinomonadaceae bacterium]|nr:tetratricopeptide repeat protein [Pyrinomonadaceae bacterium]